MATGGSLGVPALEDDESATPLLLVSAGMPDDELVSAVTDASSSSVVGALVDVSSSLVPCDEELLPDSFTAPSSPQAVIQSTMVPSPHEKRPINCMVTMLTRAMIFASQKQHVGAK
jgi:hypothetical protein